MVRQGVFTFYIDIVPISIVVVIVFIVLLLLMLLLLFLLLLLLLFILTLAFVNNHCLSTLNNIPHTILKGEKTVQRNSPVEIRGNREIVGTVRLFCIFCFHKVSQAILTR